MIKLLAIVIMVPIALYMLLILAGTVAVVMQ
jgi:hypothetical protein